MSAAEPRVVQTRVGWKIASTSRGPGAAQRAGTRHRSLTSNTQLEPGGEYVSGAALDLRAEPGVAVEVGRDVPGDVDEEAAREAIAAYGVAIELVDVGRPPADLEGIVGGNVFHRAFALGPSRPALSRCPSLPAIG